MTDNQKTDYKYKLKCACQLIIEQRITASKTAIAAAQLAANSEEKSSAGDKYETSRAIGHLEKDMHSRQLSSHLKDLASLHAVNVEKIYTAPVTGSVVMCLNVTFFIATGLGRQTFDGKPVIFLSPLAPLAATLLKLKKGDSILFDKAENLIHDIF